jgi:hypothetical protein
MAGLALLGALALAPSPLPAQSEPAFPPVEYRRQVEISVRDALERPLPGAKAEVTMEVGRLAVSGDLISDEQGLIRLTLEPVMEERLADKGIRDRFLVYDTAFAYRIHQEGRLESRGRIEDQQEFAAFTDPLYQGLDRQPTEQPLRVPVILPAYQDYLANPREQPSERDRKAIETLIGNDGHFTLAPRSFYLNDHGKMGLGLDYNLLFDPGVMGLRAAGVLLLTEPVLACLRSLVAAYQGDSRIAVFEFTVKAGFQYASEPWAIPEYRTFVYAVPADRAALLLDWTAGQPWPLQAVSVTVEGRPLDLSAGFKTTAASTGEAGQGARP